MTSNDLIPILGGLSVAVLLVGGGRRIVFANAAAIDRFGKGLVGQDLVRAVRHPECLKALDEVLDGAERAKATMVQQAPLPVTLQIWVAGLGPDGPDGARAVISFEDISHVLEAEQMRSDFVANVSHELRSPLTSLSGFIETLKGAARDDEDARLRFLNLMEGEAQRMNRLISDLLSLSKVEANERVRPIGAVDISQLLQRVIKILEAQASRISGRIRLERPDDLPAVAGEEDELVQVFQNLIENALKYGAADGEVVVAISVVETSAGFTGPVLSVAVRDHGEGIAAHHIPRLTERFYRIDTGRSRDTGGTGLGLAIVKHIIHRHRGRLQISSESGNGSTFTVLLPLAEAD